MNRVYQTEEEQMATKIGEATAIYGVPTAIAEIWHTIQQLSSANKRWIAEHLLDDVTREDEVKTIETCFREHFAAWEEETAFLSSTTLIRGNAHFKAMVDMGMDVVPYIVAQLKKEPSHLCWVLTEIFGEPITKQPMTNSEVCKLWIEKLNA